MNAEKFIWTSEEYLCSELREKFENKFPVIALVTTGYHGEKDHEAIGIDTIMRIHDWGVQQRVVAKDHRGRFITIPSNYPLKVQQLLKTLEPVGKYMTIQEFLNNNILPKTAQLDKDEVDKLYTGDRIEMFGLLEIIHSYTEKFFKTNVFKGGSLAVDDTYVIPVHLGMRFKVALGMKASSADDWTQWLNGVNQVANRVDFPSVSGIPDIFVYKKEAAGWDFNSELPLYHVRHPLTLKKGMDRYSWNMCVVSPRRDGGWTRPQPHPQDDKTPKFNQITGMKQPTLAPAVHSELLAKLGKGPKKKEMVTNPGDFAARHRMLEAIFQGREDSPDGSAREPVRRKKNVDDDLNKVLEKRRSDHVEKRDKRRSGEVDHEEDYRKRHVSGEYDTRLIPQEDNQIYGSHVPKPRGDVPMDQPRSRHKSRENAERDPRGRIIQSKVADPQSYFYGGRELSPRRGDNRERHRYFERDDREPAPRREGGFEGRKRPDVHGHMVGDPQSYMYDGKRLPDRRHRDEFEDRNGGRNGYDSRREPDPRGRPGNYRIGEVGAYHFSGPAGDNHRYESRTNRENIEALWPKRKLPVDKFADMTPKQVANCLEELHMSEHIQRFLDMGVDGLILMNLTKEDLRRDFDITGMQATRLLKFAREGWKT